ncbi:hypothetical protein N7453_000179 [Penicillium expansum]|nr:hypothetical protein N7453_000179 [Penicillium expansum]
MGCILDSPNSKSYAHCAKHHKVCESDFNLAVSDAVRDLVASFDNLLKNHKHLHHLTSTRVPLAVHNNYTQWVSERHSTLVRDTPAVYHPWDHLAVTASARCRLVGSEESVYTWHGAVVAFKSTLKLQSLPMSLTLIF